MAPNNSTAVAKSTSDSPYKLDSAQTLRASTALLRKIKADETTRQTSAPTTSLLADADDQDAEDDVPVWLVLTTKKHIVDKKRLKPGKIVLPHPYLDVNDTSLRICLITADPQRRYKDLVTHPSFPVELGKRITRVVGLEKLKSKYKSFEARRQLLGEYDVFLADDRIITYLPLVLGKVFYRSGSKRPIPVSLEGKRQSKDEQGNKRRKLAEGGTKVVKTEVKPTDVAHEIERALASTLVHLAPSATTAIKVGKASMEPAHLQANVETAVAGMVEKYVAQQWRNVRSVHIKGPNTAALPIWMAAELWEDEKDVLDEALPVKEKAKKRKRGALAEAADAPDFVEVPGPDGKMRKLENPAKRNKASSDDLAVKPVAAIAEQKVDTAEEIAAKAVDKAEKAARKEALKKQKEVAKDLATKEDIAAAKVTTVTKATVTVKADGKKKVAKKTRVKAADLI